MKGVYLYQGRCQGYPCEKTLDLLIKGQDLDVFNGGNREVQGHKGSRNFSGGDPRDETSVENDSQRNVPSHGGETFRSTDAWDA